MSQEEGNGNAEGSAGAALEVGADLLVVGHAVTGADDHVQAAEELLSSLA